MTRDEGLRVPLRFGVGNHVADAELSANIAPETDLNNLKTEWRERQVVWEPLGGRDLVIRIRLPEARAVDVLALPQSTLIGLDKVRLDLFSDDDWKVRAHTTEMQPLAEPPEVGRWRAAIDAFGVPLAKDRPEVFVRWLPRPVIYRSAEFVVRRSSLGKEDAVLAMRMLILAERVQMTHNFEYGITRSNVTRPELVRTGSAGFVPNRPQQRARRVSLTLPMMTDADCSALEDMELSLEDAPFVFSAYPGRDSWLNARSAFVARLPEELRFTQLAENQHSVSLTVAEA